ncbi:hypothetical protein EW146_g8277 [Bondarzewia mesenterica]|uniref:Nitrite reductase [NAD(P)H] n=1 Tax=Bondarzewia mesenterica TaxID=1095465 RepID=A0A4S4LHH4_9AGAM|nr:hypothetical protein EW146_g8277 [Bondarzewia mesenterica]
MTVPAVDTSPRGQQHERVFVVGLGMVGIAFIEKLLNLDTAKRYHITTCGEEPHLAYNRVGLTDYFQHRSVEDLYLHSPSWYAEQEPDRFQFYIGEQVTSIDIVAKTVSTDKDNTFSYDILVLATGSEASYPPYITSAQASSVDGVFVYRSIADLEKIIEYSGHERVNSASVVGGGLLGLEAAKAVYDLNLHEVSIINRQAYLLSRQLDAEAGEMVLRKIEAMGVRVVICAKVAGITTTPSSSREREHFTGFSMEDGSHFPSDMVICAVGIRGRDDLARQSGILCEAKGGIRVDDDLCTSAEGVYAIGECASWKGNTYGLIAPGIEMADILSFNLTQTNTSLGTHSPRKMNDPDLSTKLKLMGIDVVSFGDFFADSDPSRMQASIKFHERKEAEKEADKENIDEKGEAKVQIGLEDEKKTDVAPEGATTTAKERRGPRNLRDEPIKCLTYKDPFGYIFTADGKYLLGGMMIGDVSDYVKLVAIVKKRKPLDRPPSQFIIGSKSGGDDDGADLDDDTQVCSCHNVTKGQIGACVRSGCDTLNGIKTSTKAGTGCGGCMPLITNIFKAEMKKSGNEVSAALCPHFDMTRADLFNIIRVKRLQTWADVVREVGKNSENTVGCEVCKPAIGSILSSLFNRHVMEPDLHQLQDTNDRYLANIQRNGTFSVIPRIAGGELTPDALIAIGTVAKKYKLYTKITGAQRIDMFGAKKADLPDIWEELVKAGFESGHAYGKALRTVKSCVGTTWCRYGVGDSVGLAIQLENRYKGIRAPHKIKGGVSGCVRECAEAQSKDFGLIATDKGWNIFIAGNGGANPRHATLFAKDVPPSKVVHILDRYLMFYIRTADKLTRTARWVESFEGGIDKLKKIILEDELGICGDLEREMDELVGTFECEWAKVVNDPARRKAFQQFVNSTETVQTVEEIVERGQLRPANWPKAFPPEKMEVSQIPTPRSQWEWKKLAKVEDLVPTETGTTSAAVKYGDSALAIFHVPKRGYYATQQMCPHRRAFVLDHGIVGDDANGNLYISCPLHKKNYSLDNGDCFNDQEYKILAFDVRQDGDDLLIQLPGEDELDTVLGMARWMVKAATAEAFGKNEGTQIEIVGPNGEGMDEALIGGGCATVTAGGGCTTTGLDW